MQICVFGDVHGNIKQLEKLTKTDDFINADLRICLGDTTGLGPYQKECMDLLKNYEYIMLLGNHEARMTKQIDDLDPVLEPDIFSQFDINRAKLKDYLPMFEKLPKYYTLTIANKKFYFTHYGWSGNDVSNKDDSINNKSLTEQFGLQPGQYDYVVYGHIHTPSIITEGCTKFIDVGSLGLKCPGNYFMIYEQNGRIKFKAKHIKFNKDKFLNECKKINYPAWEHLLNIIFDNNSEKPVGTVLVTGGAGYIGSNVVCKFAKLGYKLVVVDNFSNSHKDSIERLMSKYVKNILFYDFDLKDNKKLEEIFKKDNIGSVIHLAGKKYVGESFEKQEEYYVNNVEMTKNILRLMQKYNVHNLVFPSSITVYGKIDHAVVSETDKKTPLSPYAEQKLQCEELIENWQKKTHSSAVVLRLSNPIGANIKLLLGDNPKTTKYKNVLVYLLDKARGNDKIVINGGDHPTKDGTTVRDYIHVEDIANAFFKATVLQNEEYNVFNVGSGAPGYSVLDILKQIEKHTNKKLNYSFGARRDGDVSVIITNNKKAKEQLGLKVAKKLSDMVLSQIEFEAGKTH